VRTLAECETVIEKGQQTFLEVGQALLEIRERKLYREKGFRSFETYVQKRWGWGRQRGYQLLQAAEMSTVVDVSGLDERQVRELTPLKSKPDEAQAAIREAKAEASARGRTKPTSDDVKRAVQRRAPSAKAASKQGASPEAARRRVAAENGAAEKALERERFLEAQVTSYRIAAEQLQAIDPEKLGRALSELDPMHATVQAVSDVALAIGRWHARLSDAHGDLRTYRIDATGVVIEPVVEPEPASEAAATGTETASDGGPQ
jgi:hypothetical protein